jgi:hypothetical protein
MDFTVAPQTGRSAVWYAFFIGYSLLFTTRCTPYKLLSNARAVITKNARSLLASSEYCR